MCTSHHSNNYNTVRLALLYLLTIKYYSGNDGDSSIDPFCIYTYYPYGVSEFRNIYLVTHSRCPWRQHVYWIQHMILLLFDIIIFSKIYRHSHSHIRNTIHDNIYNTLHTKPSLLESDSNDNIYGNDRFWFCFCLFFIFASLFLLLVRACLR